MIKAQTVEENIQGIKYTIEEDGEEVARTFLYIMKNDLHNEPFGFIEDVFINESKRGEGLGSKLVQHVISEAKDKGCYKIMLTAKNPESHLHTWYENLGFDFRAREYRMDF